jgi:hypothetical protein
MLILADLKLTTRIQYTIFLDFMSNLDTHINSNYLVTLLVDLLTKLRLNLSKNPQINRKNYTQRKKTFSQDNDNSEGHLASDIRHSCLRLDRQSSNSLDANKS